MTIRYVCRHCKQHLGEINHTSIDDARLGFQDLTHEERAQILAYHEAEDHWTAQVICEHCHEAVQRDPELSLQGSILH